MNYIESEVLELKSSFSEWKEIIITLSAFANKAGGTLVVGLDDKGQPLHMQLGEKTIEDFVNKIKNHTDPVLYPSINIKTFGLGEIIPQSDYKPVFAFEKAWMRVGRSNIKLSTEKLRELFVRYSDKSFDDQQVSLVNKTSLQKEWVLKLKSRGYTLSNRLNVADYLCLINVNRNYPQAIVKAARFKGNTPVIFLDTRDFDSGLLSVTDQLLDFIKKNISLQYIISGKAERTERWEYPMVALREAILNALVHRDYNDLGNIQVRIFDNYIEVWSPGLLPKELDISNLIINNRSIPRNKNILKLFHLAEEIENWGTGFARIYDACLQNGNPPPAFEERTGAFVIKIFKAISLVKKNKKSSEKSSEKVMALISNNPTATINDLANLLNVSTRYVEKLLANLKKEKRIKRTGGRKEGKWSIQ